MKLYFLVAALCVLHAAEGQMIFGKHSLFPQPSLKSLPVESKLEFPVRNMLSENEQNDYILAVHPETLPEEGGAVTVMWNSDIANENDTISISCGDKQDDSDVLDARKVPSDGTLTDTFRLENIYCDYEISYNRFNEKTQELETVVTKTVKLQGIDDKIRHVHFALGDDFSQMWISFTSLSNHSSPSVRYGKSKEFLHSHVAVGTSETYTAASMCNAPANITSQRLFRNPGFLNHVLLTDLSPSTEYFYSISLGNGKWSSPRSFTSSAAPGELEEVRFIGYGDQGVFPEGYTMSSIWVTKEIERDLARNKYHFIAHFGDISYARGEAYVWDLFFKQMSKIMLSVPYMVSVGNHEYVYTSGGENDPSGGASQDGASWHPSFGNYGDDSNGECAVPVYHRFRSPRNGHGIFWYSFDYSLVHVVQISSEHDWTVGSEQYKWLEADLASVNRTATPWIILTTHRMLYTTQMDEGGDYNVSLVFRANLDSLLEKYKVNLVLCGHQHSYERSLPVLHGKVVKQGPTHIVVGTAGAGLEEGGFSTALGDWSISHNHNHHGYCRFVATRKALKLEFVSVSLTQQVLDSAVLEPWL